MKVLGISTSPRLKGNTDLLCRRALAGAESAGATAEYVRLAELNIGPCTECGDCYRTGDCTIEDDYQPLIEKILHAELLIFATPIFFMTVCSQAKILIDRCQCFWVRKYVLKKPLPESLPPHRRAMVIAVGATKGKKMFDSVRLTMKYFLATLDFSYAANLFVNSTDAKGAIRKHPTALEEAFRLAAELARDNSAIPEKPVNIEFLE